MPRPKQLEELAARFAGLTTFLAGSKGAIGLDIGSSSIKGVKVSRSPKGFALLKVARETIPPKSDQAQRVRVIQKVLETLEPRGCALVTAVGGAGTVLRSVLLPKMTPLELKTSLSFEAEKHIPFKLEEVFLDAPIMGERPGNRMEVLLAAARRDLVNTHLELLGAAGTAPWALDLEAVALANAWEMSRRSMDNGTAALIHVGARGTILIFLVKGQLQFTREIGIGGDHFTEVLAEGLHRDLLQAEAIKCQPASQQTEVRGILQPCLEEWFGQCRTSFDFYENQFGHGVDHLILSGGSARLDGFKEYIQEAAGLPMEIWNPLAGFTEAQNSEQNAGDGIDLGVAVGCAVRGTVR